MRFQFLKVLTVGLVLLGLGRGAYALPAFADGPISAEYFSMDDGGVVANHPNVLAMARATGAPVLRLALYWKNLEPVNTTPENYNWAYADAYFQNALNGGMTPLVFITENPAWAANTPCGPVDTTNPDMLAAFAEFMGAVAARYPQIKIWILYNEADNSSVPMQTGGCFGDDVTGDVNNNRVPDYAEYAIMAGAARDAVHQANPNALLSLAVAFDDFDSVTCPPGYPGNCPPLSHFNFHFLPDLFGYMSAHPRANGQPYADLLTYTYYDIYGPYWEVQSSGKGMHGIQAKAAAIRQRMSDAGVMFPLFVSETGNDSRLNGADGQSRCVAITMVRGMAVNLRTVVWWTFMDNPDRGWYYGLVDTDTNPKPAYRAYQNLFDELNGWTYKKKRANAALVEGYLFTRDGTKKWVLWSAVTQPDYISPCAYERKMQRANFKAKRLRVVDLYGNAKFIRDNRRGDLNPQLGRITIRVTGAPIYVTLNP
jgi:hypothetical protein